MSQAVLPAYFSTGHKGTSRTSRVLSIGRRFREPPVGVRALLPQVDQLLQRLPGTHTHALSLSHRTNLEKKP